MIAQQNACFSPRSPLLGPQVNGNQPNQFQSEPESSTTQSCSRTQQSPQTVSWFFIFFASLPFFSSPPDPSERSVPKTRLKEKMLRHAPRLLSRATSSAMRWRRPFSTNVPAETPVDAKFVESWRSTIPNIEPPKTPSAFMTPRPPTPSTIPSKLTINVVLPYNSIFSAKEVITPIQFLLMNRL